MPTQPRPGAGPSTKKKGPATARPQPAAEPRNDLVTPDENASKVTGATLERREIPSFSISREARIAEAAYWRAESRGFTAGQELDDWLAAEKDVDGDSESGRVRSTRD